ncbi:Gfo/Idh/MocA family protein [Singulisphaera acidiphila]|uniref:Putative dehydrogenase n=1 Tax=Singulisphaera acidiphila (strain ATCC BAA-1392 / DSM 18658 / VKM B-2454 / MOB10) TaxID=886293 RepID=L0DPP2_SINAD|nr:putative dehydrogenase [Singulisphaera acidiphila DSM 18658]
MIAPASSSRIRVGIVGAGEWAHFGHLPVLKSLPEYELLAVATTRIATAQRAADKFAIPHAYDRFEPLIARPDLDLVVVNTRAPEHEPVARAAIAAGKHVYCEWPLTTSTTRSVELFEAAEKAGVRHVIGLQRRMAASSRYLRELLEEGFVGEVRSVRLHVSEPSFFKRRPAVLAFTIPVENFSSVVSIYGGHFLDMLFTVVGEPREFTALVASQFGQVTIEETGETIVTTAPDQMLLSGTLTAGAVFSVHVEGGKRNQFGVQLDITGTEGDLRVTNGEAFGDKQDSLIEGARGSRQPLATLPVPERLRWLPRLDLHGSILELANLYAAFARDLAEGTHHAPTFADAVRMHRLLDAIGEASGSGQRQRWS